MSTNPKGSPQNLLPNLPPERQAEIRERMKFNYRPGIRLHKVKIDFEKKRLLTILHREVEKLLVQSGAQKKAFDKEDREAVVSYLKLIREMEKADKEEEAGLTDEQLAVAAAKGG